MKQVVEIQWVKILNFINYPYIFICIVFLQFCKYRIQGFARKFFSGLFGKIHVKIMCNFPQAYISKPFNRNTYDSKALILKPGSQESEERAFACLARGPNGKVAFVVDQLQALFQQWFTEQGVMFFRNIRTRCIKVPHCFLVFVMAKVIHIFFESTHWEICPVGNGRGGPACPPFSSTTTLFHLRPPFSTYIRPFP